MQPFYMKKIESKRKKGNKKRKKQKKRDTTRTTDDREERYYSWISFAIYFVVSVSYINLYTIYIFCWLCGGVGFFVDRCDWIWIFFSRPNSGSQQKVSEWLEQYNLSSQFIDILFWVHTLLEDIFEQLFLLLSFKTR